CELINGFVYMHGCDALILVNSEHRNIGSEMVPSKNFMIRNRESIGLINWFLSRSVQGKSLVLDTVDRLDNPKRTKNNAASATDMLEKGYEALLKMQCPTRLPLNKPYILCFIGIDSSISKDPRTSQVVKLFADDHKYFFQVFASVFLKQTTKYV
ncbi:hypothetical protein MKW92_006722, partial [Papaver armeniacum]